MPERIPNRKDESADALLRAVAGRDANAQLPIVARTRRAIRIANDTRLEQGSSDATTSASRSSRSAHLIVLVAPALVEQRG